MNRRVTAAVIAAVLALGAFISIFMYVRSADLRALKDAEPRSVYIVVNTVPRGTAAEALGANVVLTQVPAKTVPENAVLDLSQIAKRITSVELVKGEILLTGRFIDPALQSSDEVAVPKGMQQMSLLLKPEQVRGGVMKAGDTVGIISTVKKTQANPVSVPGLGSVTIDNDFVTKQILSKVLVTRVQGAVVSSTSTKAEDTGAPSDAIILTVALNVADAEKLTWAMNAGTLLLTLENTDSDDSGSRYTDQTVVLK